jgi:hypothetical protein
MTTLAYSTSLVGNTNENVANVQTMFNDARTVINGSLDADNLTAATRNALALTDATTVRRGKSIIATSESIAGTGYAALTTPDRVASVVIASNTLLLVSYWCMMTKSVGGTAETASVGLFLSGTQVKSRFGTLPASGVSEGFFQAARIFTGVASSAAAVAYTEIADSSMSYLASGSGGAADDTTNGHAVGAFVPIIVAAGTYTVEMRFLKTAGATVAVSNRRLYVKAETFA